MNRLNFETVKKTAVIILLLIYGSATIGATVHLHYCMNKFAGWSLGHGKDEKCGKCGMEEKDKGSCCKDEHKHFKLKTDHQKSSAAQLISLNADPALFVPVVDFDIPACPTIIENFPFSHAPPGIGGAKLHLLHCLFLI